MVAPLPLGTELVEDTLDKAISHMLLCVHIAFRVLPFVFSRNKYGFLFLFFGSGDRLNVVSLLIIIMLIFSNWCVNLRMPKLETRSKD